MVVHVMRSPPDRRNCSTHPGLSHTAAAVFVVPATQIYVAFRTTLGVDESYQAAMHDKALLMCCDAVQYGINMFVGRRWQQRVRLWRRQMELLLHT